MTHTSSTQSRPRPLCAVLPSVLVAGLLLTVCASELLWGWRDAQTVANAVVDGPLRNALLAIDASLGSHDDDPGAPEVKWLLSSLQNGPGKRLHIRIVTPDGLPIAAGSGDLPRGNAPWAPGQVQFQDAQVSGQTLRVASLARLPDATRRSGRPPAPSLLIQVADSAASRDALAHHLMVRALLRDLGLALLAGLLAFATLAWGMRPLKRFTDTLAGRKQDDLTPLPTHALPGDVQVLVHGVNQHLARVQGLVDTRRRFMDDTAHQLRAPLTILQTQVSCALREPDPTLLRKALDAIHRQLDDAVRQTQQMLTLARTDDADFVLLPTDVHAVAAACARDWWRTARAHGITLNFDAEHAPPMLVCGHAGLIKEALANLLHNAVRHASAGGHITVGLQFGGDGHTIRLSVTDDGPGIPEADLPRIGERYFRASNTQGAGSGLGLAIVRAIIERHRGQMQLGIGHEGRGLAITLVLPTASPTT
jgi:two-component system sensor histidine kinase TctE